MDATTEIARVRKTVQEYLAGEYALVKDTIDAIEVKTDDDMKNAGDFRIKVNKFCKLLEEKRKEEVDPYNAIVKGINTEFKQATVLFDKELGRLDDKIKPYLQEVARKKEAWAKAQREKELAEMEARKQAAAKLAQETQQAAFVDQTAAIAKEQEVLAAAPVTVHKSVKSDDTSTALVDNWKATIKDASLVPREYCIPDEKALNKLAKIKAEEIKAGTFRIPGVAFVNESFIGSRAR
jgi:hypothetical protein